MIRRDYLPFGRPNFGDEEIAAVTRVLRSGWVGMGPETMAFEEELAAAVGASHVVAVNSCTSALFLALVTAGVGTGDEVICPSFTWCSPRERGAVRGARPVFCDIDPDTLCVTPGTIAAQLTARTRAVIVVHFGGLAVDVAAVRNVLPPHVRIIEDAAHAFGAAYPDGAPVGSESGNPTCFSFYANKNLSTGEGGAVALAEGATADRLRSLRQHAPPLDAWKRFTHAGTLLLSNQLTELGYKDTNYTECAGGDRPRAAVAGRGVPPHPAGDRAPVTPEGLCELVPPLTFQRGCTSEGHARHLITVQLPVADLNMTRDEVILALRARNLGASIHYAPYCHLMPLYQGQQRGPASARDGARQ